MKNEIYDVKFRKIINELEQEEKIEKEKRKTKIRIILISLEKLICFLSLIFSSAIAFIYHQWGGVLIFTIGASLLFTRLAFERYSKK